MAWNDMTMGCASRRRWFPVVALAFAVAALGAGHDANPAAPIAAAAGHPSRLHLRAEATFVHDGAHATATLETEGPRRLERVCFDGLCRGSWFDGRQAYTFGINGTPLPESDADPARERTFAAIASTAFGEPAFTAAGGTVEALAPTDRLRFRVAAPDGGADLLAVADPHTLRLTAVELPDGSPYRSLAATIGSAQTVFAARPYDRVGPAAAALEPPHGPAVAPNNAENPLPELSTELPIVPCTIEQVAASCLIDTGTTPSAVTLAFAERLGVEPHGQIEIGGLSNYLTGAVEIGPLAVGGVTFGRLSLAVIPRVRAVRFDVILGSDALAGVRVEIDRRRRSIRLTADTALPSAGSGTALRFAAGLPYVAVRLGTRAPSEAMLLDTGDSGTLSIGYDEYREEEQLFEARGAGQAHGTGDAVMDTITGTLAHAQIGDTPLDAVPIAAVRGQHTGHVGYGFVSRCARFALALGEQTVRCDVPTPAATASAGDRRR